MPLNLEDSKKADHPDNPRIVRVDKITGATRSVTPLPDLRSGDIIVESSVEEELQKLRQDLDKYRADYTANQAAQEQCEKIAERKRAWFGIVSNTVSAIIGGLIVYYWPAIVAFLKKMFN